MKNNNWESRSEWIIILYFFNKWRKGSEIEGKNKSHDDKAMQLSKKEKKVIDEGENNEVEIKIPLPFSILRRMHSGIFCSSSWLWKNEN